MKKTPQNPVYHGEGDVYAHTVMVYKELIKNAAFCTCGLCGTEENMQLREADVKGRIAPDMEDSLGKIELCRISGRSRSACLNGTARACGSYIWKRSGTSR